ncbi:hypothetical protein QQM79_10560 [Marinobacteraceae bacterium S3BR75-40.1]
MASENTGNRNNLGTRDPLLRDSPVVHRGPTPVRAPARIEQPESSETTSDQETTSPPAPQSSETQAIPETEPTGSATRVDERQHWAQRVAHRRRLLQSCQAIQLYDYGLLSLPGWPENRALAMAARRRDYWILVMSLFALCFVAGMMDVAPAWVGGAGFGSFMVGLLLLLPPIRKMLVSSQSYFELRAVRRRLMRQARAHITHLEGQNGLAWCCRELGEFNENLKGNRYQGIYRLSHAGTLPHYIRSRAHVRLYLMFLLEADRAYRALERAYQRDMMRGLDQGWVEEKPA